MLVESSRQATLIAGEVGEKKLTFDASSAEFGQDESLPDDLPTHFFLSQYQSIAYYCACLDFERVSWLEQWSMACVITLLCIRIFDTRSLSCSMQSRLCRSMLLSKITIVNNSLVCQILWTVAHGQVLVDHIFMWNRVTVSGCRWLFLQNQSIIGSSIFSRINLCSSLKLYRMDSVTKRIVKISELPRLTAVDFDIILSASIIFQSFCLDFSRMVFVEIVLSKFDNYDCILCFISGMAESSRSVFFRMITGLRGGRGAGGRGETKTGCSLLYSLI